LVAVYRHFTRRQQQGRLKAMSRVLRVVTATLLLLAFIGCASTGNYAPSGVGAEEARIARRFPTQLGPFSLYGAVNYDMRGDPVATYYAGRLIALDAYYYRDQQDFAGHYAECKAAVKTVHPKARLVSDEPCNLQPGGRRAVFTLSAPFLGGSTIPLRSELLLFPRGNRFFKIRATYRAEQADRAHAEISSFAQNLKLP
jgi:hypothetical protein